MLSNSRLSSLLVLAATAFTSTTAATIDVHVGVNDALVFNPDSLTAHIGDMVQFHFYSFHSVTESEFTTPCAPKSGGFYSGSIDGNSSGNKTFIIEVTSTDPIWFYCAVAAHCNEGMVGVINPPSGETEAQYASAAASAMIVVPSAVADGTLTTIASGAMASSMMSSSVMSSSVMSSSVMSSAMMTGSMTSSMMSKSTSMPASTTSMSMSMSMSSSASMSSPSSSSGTSGAGSVVIARDGTVFMGLALFSGALVAFMA